MINMFLLNDKKTLFIISGIIFIIISSLTTMFVLKINILNIVISICISIGSGSLFAYFLILLFNTNKQEYIILGIKEYDMNMNYINLFNFYKKRYKYEISVNNEKKWTSSDYLKKYNIGDNITIYTNNLSNKYSNNILIPLIGSGLLFVTFTILPLLSRQ